jgi:hypothetical protein
LTNALSCPGPSSHEAREVPAGRRFFENQIETLFLFNSDTESINPANKSEITLSAGILSRLRVPAYQKYRKMLMKKLWFLTSALACLLLFLSSPPWAQNENSPEEYEIFSCHDASYSLLIPRAVSEKSISASRVSWNYLAPGSTSPLSIRINNVFIGISISHDEYMSILEESKRNDGLETRKVKMENGRAFTYESKAKKSDDETQDVYLVALSEKGWICTLTFSGKCAILKRERPVITRIMESFQFVVDRKK